MRNTAFPKAENFSGLPLLFRRSNLRKSGVFTPEKSIHPKHHIRNDGLPVPGPLSAGHSWLEGVFTGT
jgi:hypothetical protein